MTHARQIILCKRHARRLQNINSETFRNINNTTSSYPVKLTVNERKYAKEYFITIKTVFTIQIDLSSIIYDKL